MVISVSATTRPRRPRETEGVDYYFLSDEQFQEHIRKGNFLEYEEVHGKYYGTLKSVVEEHLKAGRVVVFDIDVKGALSIKRQYPEAILIFIKAPSEEELVRRLRKRASETDESIRKRLERLPLEYELAKQFDHVITNKYLPDTLAQIGSIILQEEN